MSAILHEGATSKTNTKQTNFVMASSSNDVEDLRTQPF